LNGLVSLPFSARRAKSGTGYLHTMLIVGLTGGIGSGKSTVARLLADRGALIVDVDAIGRAVIAPGGRAEAGVLAEFGSAIAAADGTIDRPSLARLVFEHPEALARLNAISHPAINAELTDRIGSLPDGSVVVYDMAVLVESNLGRQHPSHRYAHVVVVEAPLKLRIERAVARGMREADAHAWLEVLVPGRGFVEADPTPAGAYDEAHGGIERGGLQAVFAWLNGRWTELRALVGARAGWALLARLGEVARALLRGRPGLVTLAAALLAAGWLVRRIWPVVRKWRAKRRARLPLRALARCTPSRRPEWRRR